MSEPFRATGVSEVPGNPSRPRWPMVVAILTAVLMAAGAVIAITRPQMLAASGNINETVHIYAGYLVSRNLAVAILLLVTVAIKARKALADFLILAALIQFLDAVMDCLEGRWSLIPGILVIGVLSSMAAARLSGHPVWTRSFWRSSASINL